ncbi:MFS transporter [Filibacter tadaridae]|uniref:Putative transporter YycB n=1 Tax=Filibacter tadaridae TaxID=2483811 RepID=A0A3P5XNK6_9BACL|nr:MFS transporter [Filibacter tadaridae]VDC29400.1 putative transporter YycB [Filibacter tadaridae]
MSKKKAIHTTKRLNLGRKTWILLIGIILMASTLRAPLTSVGPLISPIREGLAISNGLAGFITTIPLLAFAILSPFAPRIARTFGMERTLFGALLLLTAGIIIRSIGNAPTLLIGTFLLGLAIAFGNVLLPSLVKLNFPLQIGLMTGIYTVSMNLSASIAAGISVPLNYATNLGWTFSLGIWSLLAVIALLAWSPQLKNRTGISTNLNPTTKNSQSFSLIRSPLVWSITFFMGLQSLIFYTTAAWVPEVLTSQGLNANKSGWMLSLLQISQIPVTFIVPILADKVKDQRTIVISIASFYLLGFTGILFGNPSLAPLWMILIGVAGGGSFGLAMMFFTLRTRTPHEAAKLSGFAQSVGYTFAAIGPVLFGLLHDYTSGWTMSMLILFASAFLLFIFGMKAGKDEFVFPVVNNPSL